MIECLTCHGRYDPVLPDGTRYFHRCPPLSVAELHAALQAGAVPLSPAQQAQLAAAQTADSQTSPAPDQPTHVDRVLATLTVDRPNLRDDNVQGGRDPQTASTPKAIGLGVRTLP